MNGEETARQELLALARLIRRPPVDDIQLDQAVALRIAAAIDKLHLNATPPQTPDVPPEVVERALALVKRLAEIPRDLPFWNEARAIVALMEPVDADLVEARERAIALLSKTAVSNGLPDQHPAIIRIREGRGDHNSFVVDILAAIKRGRSLAAGEG